jgi:general secretion pathway protein D
MAMDNKKATINITEQVPIPKWTPVSIATGTASTNSYLEKTFEYRDVGLKLDVTPKINESNMLALEISQEVSEVKSIDTEGAVWTNKRTANSNVVVKDGQTIIIGGLIQNKLNRSKTGVPFFSDIPLIGKLFGGSSHKVDKTELLIFITPHVVATQEQVKELTNEFKNKVESIKELTKSAGETK